MVDQRTHGSAFYFLLSVKATREQQSMYTGCRLWITCSVTESSGMRSVMIMLRVISLPDLVAMGYELGNIHNLEQAET